MEATCDVNQMEVENKKPEAASRSISPVRNVRKEQDNYVIIKEKQNASVNPAIAVDNWSEQQDGDQVISGKEVAVQADEHEIERVSNNLPQRQKFVPLRFSDYRVFAGHVKEDEEEEEEEDTDFNPSESISKSTTAKQIKQVKAKRGRGRPRKHADNDPVQETRATDKETFGPNTMKKVIIKVANGFKCCICKRVFSLRGNAKAHLITHSNDKPYQCADFPGCDKRFRTKESLRRHKLSHLGIKMFECSECKKKFSCNLSLQEHMTLHTGEKPLSCEICGRKFRQVAVLKRHLITHSSDKPFACGVCGRRFALKIYVHSHMKTHTGERPFSCDICNKAFAHASDLNRHKIIHSGKKPYQCSICSMRYSDPSSRRRHEREHQNKQQYICHICNQRFPRAGQLRVHIVKEHSSEQASLPYRVEMRVKSVSKPWADGDATNKSDAVTSAINSNVVSNVSRVSDVQSENLGDNNSFMETVPAQTMQLVFEGANSNQVGCIVSDGIVIQESGASADKGGDQTMIVELPRGIEELAGFQYPKTYRIVNLDDKNQIYELHVEGSQLPSQDDSNSLKINVSDIKIKDETVALIHDGDTLREIGQSESDPDPAVKLKENTTALTRDSLGRSDADNSTEVVVDTTEVHETVVAIVANNPNDLQKTPEPDQNTDTLLEQADDAISLNTDESLPVIEMKSDADTVQDTDGDKDNNVTFSSIINSDFVSNPDLNSQGYYNWLAAFSSACKQLTLPLERDVFLKISQVQKTLSDFMAIPSGVISDKNNFKILMNITQDLSVITSSHLSLMYSNLSQ